MFYEISFQFALLLLTFILYQIKVKSFPELLPAPEVESVCCLDCFGKKGSAMTHITRRSFLKASVAAGAAALVSGAALPAAAAGAASSAVTPAASASSEAEEENCLFSSASVTDAALPQGGWQGQPTFPDWAGYVDDTLAMNGMYTFYGYSGQGTLYICPAAGVTSFVFFINNHKVDTSKMAGGGTWAVDISACTVNGLNTFQIGCIQPAGQTIQVFIPYPTVIQGKPSDVGLNTAVLDAIDAIVSADVARGFPSAQMAIVKDGRMIYQKAWGTVNAYNPDGTPKTDSPAVTNDTMYDLASNTKMYSVNYAMQYLVTQGQVKLDTKIADLLGSAFVDSTIDITYSGYDNPGLETVKQWKSQLTIRDVLRHQAGFPADPQYYNDGFDQSTQKNAPGVTNVLYSGAGGDEATRQRTLQVICMTPLMYQPGTKTLYSDVDYMLLDFVIEQVTGTRLDDFLSAHFWQPMGLTHVTYQPLKHGFSPNDCAATELNGDTRDGSISFAGARTATIQGEVHDGKAYHCMAGVSGHAGLFASASDLAILASVMLTGGYGNLSFFSRNVMDTFTAPKIESAATWGLGWWREADLGRPWYFGTQSSSGTVGHQGWTGTLTFIDPAEHLVVVYLTNKINSRLTDTAASVTQFNGNWYTASTLGFVAQLLYQGFKSRAGSPDAALDAMLADMASEHFKLVDPDFTTGHPRVQSAYALLEVLVDRACNTLRPGPHAYAQDALNLLDPVRDADELAALRQRL